MRGFGRFDAERAEEQIGQVELKSSAGAPVFVRDVASVVIGGLITAALLTLFVLPVLYELVAGKTPPRLALHNLIHGLKKSAQPTAATITSRV